METIQKVDNMHSFGTALSQSYERLNGEDVSAAISLLENIPLPTRRDEYWKYTPTNKIAKTPWSFDINPRSSVYENLVSKYPNRFVFVNGVFQSSLSNASEANGVSLSLNAPKGLTARSHDPSPFLDLNHALPQKGYQIEVAKNTKVEGILHVIYIYEGDQNLAQPNSQIHVNKGAELKLTELHMHLGEGATLANISTQVKVEDNASFSMDILQEGHSKSFQLQQMDVEIGNNTRFLQNTFTLSGGWVRNNTNVKINGSGSEANVNGFYIPNDKEHVDNHTVVDHLMPHCDSNELYRGVLLDKSTAVFNGKVYVRPDAQKTNAFQSNGNILMSDDATINSKPELEIYADDVKCSHGSTTGQFDDVALFYLMARGISKETARKMLVGAFAEDVIDKLANPDLREYIEAEMHRKLS